MHPDFADVLAHTSADDAAAAALRVLVAQSHVVAAGWLAAESNGRFALRSQSGELFARPKFAERLERWSAAVCEQGRRRTFRVDEVRDLAIHCFPVPPLGALAVAATNDWQRPSTPECLPVCEAVAATLQLRQAQRESHQARQESHTVAAAFDLLQRVSRTPNPQSACFTLANDLQAFFDCRRVVVGLCRGQDVCRTAAVSGLATFDRRSAAIDDYDAALNETLPRNGLVAWPALDPRERHGLLALTRLAEQQGCEAVLGLALRTSDERLIGAVLLLGSRAKLHDAPGRRLLAASGTALADALDTVDRAAAGAWTRLWRELTGQVSTGHVAISLREMSPSQTGVDGTRLISRSEMATSTRHPSLARRAFFFLLLVAALGGLLALPAPYRVGCRCTAEPTLRRIAVAPQDGLVETTLVEPGDVVRRGDLLARLDGREVRWKLAGLVAERHQAAKERDKSLAAADITRTQLAELEIARLDAKMRVLRFQEENLDITSPLDGLVLSGTFERQSSAPVTLGQPLFEIAPLDPIRIEVAVPAEEFVLVAVGQPVEIEIDGLTGRTFTGTTTRLRPKSEVRDDRNVFVADVVLANPDHLLRPGMKGHARLTAGRFPLGWNWFHRPWQQLGRW